VFVAQMFELADAAGFSAVHISCIFKGLRQLGVLSKQQPIQVVNRERLQEPAAFEAACLDAGGALCRWDLRVGSQGL
jgi:hypothetical protein